MNRMYSYSILLLLAVLSWALQLDNTVQALTACYGLRCQYCAVSLPEAVLSVVCVSPARIFYALGLIFSGHMSSPGQPRPPPTSYARCNLEHVYHSQPASLSILPAVVPDGQYLFCSPSDIFPHDVKHLSHALIFSFILHEGNSSTGFIPLMTGNCQLVYLVVVRDYSAHL